MALCIWWGTWPCAATPRLVAVEVIAIEIQQRMVIEYGIELDGVWLPLGMLRRLDEHGPWNVPFTEATSEQVKVLMANGLAERHNTGLARGCGLRNFIDALPFAPTDAFSKIRPGGDDAAGYQ
jgi:hypothetical protein